MTFEVRFLVKRVLNEIALNIMTSLFSLIRKLFSNQDCCIPKQSVWLSISIGVAKDAHVNLVVVADGAGKGALSGGGRLIGSKPSWQSTRAVQQNRYTAAYVF